MPPTAVITSKRRLAQGVFEFSVRPDRPFGFQAGQYARVSIPALLADDPKGPGRDLSMVSAPGEPELTFVFRGTGSGYKHSLLDGATHFVYLAGPFGAFTLPDDPDISLSFIAGGVGIAPFISMLRHQPTGRDIDLIYADSTPDGPPYLSELSELERNLTRFNLRHLPGRVGPTDLPQPDSGMVYISGPPAMTRAVRAMLKDAGTDVRLIRTEEFLGYE